MFALLGLFDWAFVPGTESNQSMAADLFQRGLLTLEKILPYYDMGTITAYDLGYMTFRGELPHLDARYHAVHIYLLHAVYSIGGNDIFHTYEKRWISYIDDA